MKNRLNKEIMKSAKYLNKENTFTSYSRSYSSIGHLIKYFAVKWQIVAKHPNGDAICKVVKSMDPSMPEDVSQTFEAFDMWYIKEQDLSNPCNRALEDARLGIKTQIIHEFDGTDTLNLNIVEVSRDRA